MKLHNTYTVKIAGQTVTAFNSITANYWANIKKYPYWANFIALTADDGTSVYAPATVEITNCDPSRGGEIFVRYTASVDCLNKHYISVSLCADKTATGFMSTASLDLVSAGDTAEIAAVIYLETVDDDYVTFCAGDNPLIRRLLGCGEEFPVRVGWGTYNYPSQVCERTTDLIEEFFDAELTFTDSGISVKVDEPTYGVELVLFTGDTSLMRAVRPYSLDLTIEAVAVDEHIALKIPPDVESVSNITVKGSRLINVDSHSIIDSITPVSAEHLMNLGTEGSVRTDPAGEYVLFTSTAFMEVYKIEGTSLRLLLRISDSFEFSEICRGGAVFAATGSTITVYEPDSDENYTVFTQLLDIKPVYTKCGVSREGARYHLAAFCDAYINRYEITRSSVKFLSKEAASYPASVVGRCGDALIMAGPDICVKTLDADYSSEYNLEIASNDLNVKSNIGTADGFILMYMLSGSMAYDIVRNTTKYTRDRLTASGRIAYSTTQLYIYDHYNGYVKYETDMDLSDVTSMCLAGDNLFVLRGTKLYLYKCNSEYTAVRLPVAAENTVVTYNTRKRVYKGNGKGATLTVSGE